MQASGEYDMYKETISNLYLLNPEFKEFIEMSIDDDFHYNAYLIFGPLGGFLVDSVVENGPSSISDKVFAFVNEMCENDDKNIIKCCPLLFLNI